MTSEPWISPPAPPPTSPPPLLSPPPAPRLPHIASCSEWDCFFIAEYVESPEQSDVQFVE